ncbi:GAF and ANTAR domain-containing protein [Thermasporomyces composti]|uniref:GAF and ANTAR domain-containing protein n=1 Tax=Thermasporomyces composti TaxID=696763 RepID=UPI000E226D54|nr:GAF and ANTAR domain-containing protein [Thermasporomyces composti]
MGVDVSRDYLVSEALVKLSDTLVPDFEVGTFSGRLADTAVELLRAAAAIVRLADDHGHLDAVPSTAARERVSALLSPPDDQGPGHDAVRSTSPVTCPDLDAAPPHWTDFASHARRLGFRSVRAWPLRYDTQVLGAVELYYEGTGDDGDTDGRLAETLARVAAITLVRERRRRQAETLAQQLQRALDSRLVIEQAKGILAERRGIPIDEAFTILRGFARSNQMRLAVLAHQVIDGTADDRLLTHATRSGPGRPAQDRAGRAAPSRPTQSRPAQSQLAQGRLAQGRPAQGRPAHGRPTRDQGTLAQAAARPVWGRSTTTPPGRPESPTPARLAGQPGPRTTPEPWRNRSEQRRPPQPPGQAEPDRP